MTRDGQQGLPRGVRAAVAALALLGSAAGAFVVVRILWKSGFGAHLAFMANETLVHGIGWLVLAALCWAVLAWRAPRWLWLSALCLVAAAGIFGAYYAGIACTSKKRDTCEPLLPSWQPRPSLPWSSVPVPPR